MNICKMKRSTQIAIMANAGSTTVEKTVSGMSPLTLLDSVAGNIRTIKVKGHSEVVDGAIKSVGDAGWGVVDLGALTWEYGSNTQTFLSSIVGGKYTGAMQGVPAYCSIYNVVIDIPTVEMKNLDIKVGNYSAGLNFCSVLVKNFGYTDATAFKSAMSGVLLYYPLADAIGATPIFGITSKNGSGQGTAATITTGLPLRSTLDGTVYDELTNEKVITRCEVVDNEVVPLTTPVETSLTSSEVAALASLSTYDPTTIISMTDNPSVTVTYLGRSTTRTASKKRTSRKKKS